MAARITIEHRKNDADKWEPYGAFDDFDTCHKHILDLRKKDGRVVRLIIPGGFDLTVDQKGTLEDLGVQHNT